MQWWEYVIVISVSLISGWFGAWIRMRLAHRKLELQRLYDARSKLYLQVIEPYIRATQKAQSPKEVRQLEQQIRSFEYRKAMTELTLVGSDAVVEAVNEFMGYMYKREQADVQADTDVIEFLRLWGAVYLAIRRDLGNPYTRLKELDMFRHMITDFSTIEASSGDK